MFRRAKAIKLQNFQFSLNGMYFLLAGLAIVLLPHTEHLPIWLTLSCLSLLLWRLLIDVRRLSSPNKYVILVLFVAITLSVATHYKTIVGREAGTALLVSLLCLKLFEIKSLRDISLIVQLALFTIVVTFLFSQSILVALMMLASVTLLLTALISFVHAKTTQPNFVTSEKVHVKLVMKMVLYALPLAVVIFILFPRTSSPLWGLPNDAFAAKTGLAEDMSPGEISHLADSQEVAFRVQFHAALPDPTKIYWRGPVLWNFDGRTWTAPITERRAVKKYNLEQTAQPVSYTLTLEPHNSNWLFALDLPGAVPEIGVLTTEMQVISRKPINHLVRYDMTSYLNYIFPKLAWMPLDRYLAIPSDTAPRTRQLVRELQSQYPDTPQLVNVVLQRFSDQDYYYSRNPPVLSGDPTDEFLFETKRGFCEHYASSFTMMMRLAGIPARVVTGYQGGEMNPLSNYLIVRQSNAHAWSEIYLNGRGWVRVDPTAYIPPSHIENTSDAERIRTGLFKFENISDRRWYSVPIRQLQYTWDMLNYRWSQWVIGYSDEKQKSLFTAIGVPEITWRGLSYLLFATLSGLVLLIAANIFKMKRLPQSRYEKIYAQFLRKLGHLKLEKSGAEGALNFSKRVAVVVPKQSAELINIANLYNQLRYAEDSPAAVDELRQAVRLFKIR